MSLLRHGPDKKKKKFLYQGQSRRKLLQERDTINLVGLKAWSNFVETINLARTLCNSFFLLFFLLFSPLSFYVNLKNETNRDIIRILFHEI